MSDRDENPQSGSWEEETGLAAPWRASQEVQIRGGKSRELLIHVEIFSGYASCDCSEYKLILNQCSKSWPLFCFSNPHFSGYTVIFLTSIRSSYFVSSFPYKHNKTILSAGFYLRISGPGWWTFSGGHVCWFSQEYLTSWTNVKYFS